MSTVRGSGKILGLGLVAFIAIACVAVFFLWHGSAPTDKSAPSASDSQAAAAAPVTPEPAAAAPVAASVPVDATMADRVMHGPFEKELTTEQEARLQALRKEFGELASRAALADREADDMRAQSVGLPGVKEHVEALKAARSALDAYARGLPERARAEASVREATSRDSECRARCEAFEAHVETHLKAPAAEAPAGCEWCRRDAARIAVRDSTLGRVYNEEAEALAKAALDAGQALRKARIDLSATIRSAPATEGGQALAERVDAEQKAVAEAMAALPDVARLRADANEARARQKVLADEMASIYRTARRVTPSVAKNGDTKDGETVRGP